MRSNGYRIGPASTHQRKQARDFSWSVWFARREQRIRVASLFALLLVVACRAPAPEYAEPVPTDTPWCVRAVVVSEGVAHPVLACTDEEAFCTNNRVAIVEVTRGPMRAFVKARLRTIGECTLAVGVDGEPVLAIEEEP